MNDTPLSARPPRSRFDVLDKPAAQAFVNQAPDMVAAAEEEGQGATSALALPLPEPQATAQVPALSPAVESAPAPTNDDAPQEETDEKYWKTMSVRLRPSTHQKLRYVADNSKHSANGVINELLSRALDEAIAKLEEIKKQHLDKLF